MAHCVSQLQTFHEDSPGKCVGVSHEEAKPRRRFRNANLLQNRAFGIWYTLERSDARHIIEALVGKGQLGRVRLPNISLRDELHSKLDGDGRQIDSRQH